MAAEWKSWDTRGLLLKSDYKCLCYLPIRTTCINSETSNQQR